MLDLIRRLVRPFTNGGSTSNMVSTNKVQDVLAGHAKWTVECSDCLEWLGRQPDNSIDLVFSSPPY